jgi:hypothetical protein
MNYQGFMRPFWNWMNRNPEITGGFQGLPFAMPKIDGQQFVASMQEFNASIPWRSLTASMLILDSHDTARFRTVVLGDRSAHIAAMTMLLTYPGVPDLINYLTQPQGILVSAIGQCRGGLAGYTEAANTAGYANAMIVRNSFQDPTLGLTVVNSWVTNYVTTLATFTSASGSITITPVAGGSVTLTGLSSGLAYTAGMQILVTGATTTNSFTGTVTSYSSTTMVVGSIANITGSFGSGAVYTARAGLIPSAGRLINMNHQIQIIMRVITREMDSAAKLRPDNLQA